MRRVRELFQKRGVTALANDFIVDVGLSLLAVSSAIIYVFISLALFAVALDINGGELGGADTVTFWGFIGPLIFGAVACVLLVSTVLEVVRSGFKAVFVCFVQVRQETLTQSTMKERRRHLFGPRALFEAVDVLGAKLSEICFWSIICVKRSKY